VPRYTSDGGVVPNDIREFPDMGVDEHYQKFGIYRGTIQRAVFPDEEENVTGELEYIVTIRGQDYYGVPDTYHSGGIFSNHIRVRRGAEAISPIELGIATALGGGKDMVFEEKKDGEFVWCAFLGGNNDHPVILGSAIHPRLVENPEYSNFKPTKDKGEFERFEFNGYEFMVDKEANLTIKHIGQKKFVGGILLPVPVNPEATLPNPSQIQWMKNGDFFIDINDSLLKTSYIKAEAKITHELGPGLKIEHDGIGDKTTFTTVTGLVFSLEGSVADKVTITTALGTEFSVDGASDAVNIKAVFGDELSVSAADGIKGSTPSGTSLLFKLGAVELEGTGGKLKLFGGQIGIGGAAGELVDECIKWIDQSIAHCDEQINILTALQAETHIGNLGYPTGPPINLAAYAASQVAVTAIKVQMTAVKVVLTALKGGV
jgi:hypothetical protein